MSKQRLSLFSLPPLFFSFFLSVLKHRLYYYWGIGGQRIRRWQLPLKGWFVTHSSQGGPCCATRGTCGEGSTRVSQEAAGQRWKQGQEPALWFLKEGTGQEKWAGLGFASLNNFSRLWPLGVFSSCLGPGSEWFRTKEVGEGMDAGLVDSHIKGLLWASCLLPPRNSLTLGEEVPPQAHRAPRRQSLTK